MAASIKKVAVALTVAIAAHAAVLVYGVAPRVEGLTEGEPGPSASGEPVADNTPQSSDEDRSIDIGFGETSKPAPKAEPSKPKLAEVAEVTPPPPPEPKPEPRPEPKAAAKPEPKLDSKPALPPSKPAVVAAKPAAKPESKPEPKPASAKPAAVASARSAGGGSTVAAVMADAGYANRVRQHLGRFAGALPPGAVGEARVQFVVQPDGRVTEVQLVKRSGSSALDALALSLPVQAQPLPLPGAVPQLLEVPLQAAGPAP